MTKLRYPALVVAVLASLSVVPLGTAAHAQSQDLIPSPDGMTIYDTVLHVNWLKNGNPATTYNPAGLTIDPGGTMDYNTAKLWRDSLNAPTDQYPNGYLGHSNWTLPTSPASYPDPDNPGTIIHGDDTCSTIGPPGSPENSFGYACTASAMGSLYNRHHNYPHTAVPVPNVMTGPFYNFQPYYYLTGTQSGNPRSGYTFSFNTGVQGSNAGDNYMYVLPMMDGQLCAPRYDCTPGTGDYVQFGLHTWVTRDGRVVYDDDAADPYPDAGAPATGVTWLANANLAKSRSFGVNCVMVLDPHTNYEIPCINPDGAMARSTAETWVEHMRTYVNGDGSIGWLGSTTWKLPPMDDNTDACDGHGPTGFLCLHSLLGHLYYVELALPIGTPAVQAAANDANLQPYLYWSCSSLFEEVDGINTDTHTCDDAHPPDTNFGWSFSFGNGFQGTEVIFNHLYVMVYYPISTKDALKEALDAVLGPSGTHPDSVLLDRARQAVDDIDASTTRAQLRTRTTRFVTWANAGVGTGVLLPDQNEQIVALITVLAREIAAAH